MHKEHREAELEILEDLIIAELRRRIEEGGASSSDLEVARKLLKDNNIADGRTQAPIRELARELPYSSVDEEIE